MQTEWIWEAKANQAILTEKRSQKVWLKQDLLNRKHVYALLQRSRDIFFSLLAIIVLSPLMLLTALLIVLDDPHGGPIFSQYRVGKNGRKFKLYKFRSMVTPTARHMFRKCRAVVSPSVPMHWTWQPLPLSKALEYRLHAVGRK